MGELSGPFKTGSSKLAAVRGFGDLRLASFPDRAHLCFENRPKQAHGNLQWPMGKGQSGNPGGRPRVCGTCKHSHASPVTKRFAPFGELMRSDQPLQVFGFARPSCYWIGVGVGHCKPRFPQTWTSDSLPTRS